MVGSGPAGICAADALTASDTASERGVSIDLYERLPAPFGHLQGIPFDTRPGVVLMKPDASSTRARTWPGSTRRAGSSADP
ncbi:MULTISPECIES: NAD(P)-binding protein [unclassified Rhodococcus (in: high G+C Gram-positive bacteria)]|uniref:NAD(P)-binding protein n=1 Tax=unclassified Rhodococcus (in: high G+C Gram-positive bacteria) TaxID=192944 RepID=UPI0035A8E8FB